jgi:hypothetical protein
LVLLWQNRVGISGPPRHQPFGLFRYTAPAQNLDLDLDRVNRSATVGSLSARVQGRAVGTRDTRMSSGVSASRPKAGVLSVLMNSNRPASSILTRTT